MSTSRGDRPGLRERKKAQTRATLQDQALRLFTEQGYEQTTVEQIAAAAEVSPSTFFRYFPTKEDTVAYDRLDPVMLESFVEQPVELPPIAALRGALRDVVSSIRAEESATARQRLVFSVPELRMRLIDRMSSMTAPLSRAVAERTGLSPDDLAIRTWTGAVVGVALSAYFATADHPDAFFEALDRGLAQLEAGLPLSPLPG